MKRKHYIWMLAILLFLLFGGRYVRDYKSYHRIEKIQQLNEDTIMYLTLTPHHAKNRYLIFYCSDVYGAPYQLDFVAKMKGKMDKKVQIYQGLYNTMGGSIGYWKPVQ